VPLPGQIQGRRPPAIAVAPKNRDFHR
jgi:hypothetical protein